MESSSSNFPYPILTSKTGDYKTTYFKVDFEQPEFVKNKVIFKFIYELTNSEIKALLEKGQAAFGIDLECGETKYRKFIELRGHEKEFEVDADNLSGSVYLQPVIISKQNIRSFSSPDFGDMFSGYEINLSCGEPLAIDQKRKVEITYPDENSLNMESIIKYVGVQNQKDVSFDFSDDFIKILMPEPLFNKIHPYFKNQSLEPLIMDLLYIPAIAIGLEILKEYNNGTNPDEWQPAYNAKWQEPLLAALKSLKVKDSSFDGWSYRAAQLIVKCDSKKISYEQSFDYILNIH